MANTKVRGIKYGTIRQYLRQQKDPDTLYFITDKGLLYRGDSIVVPTKFIDIELNSNGDRNDSYKFTIETYSGDPANPDTLTFDVYSTTAVDNVIRLLQNTISAHSNSTATNQLLAHVRLSDATTDAATDAATGGTAATPKAVASVRNELIQYIDTQIGSLSQGMRIIGTYGNDADHPDESRPLDSIAATEGDTYVCVSQMTGVDYTNGAGTTVDDATLNPGDYIICVASAEAQQGTVTTPARWTIVANPNTTAVTTTETLTDGAVVVGNGNKTVRRLEGGSAGQFVRMGANGKAVWGAHGNTDHGIAHGMCLTSPEPSGAMETQIEGFLLKPFAIVAVNFANGAQRDSTLNVSETGRLPIVYHNNNLDDNIIEKGDTATFMFVPGFELGGQQTDAWVLIAIDRAPDNTPDTLSGFLNDIQGIGTCSSNYGTPQKQVSMPGVSIAKGSVFAVRFSNQVGSGATMKVNSQSAKPIRHRNLDLTDNQIMAGDTATFICDGNYYHLLAVDRPIDSSPNPGSRNFVESGGIYQMIQSAIDEATLHWEEME